MQQGEPDEPQEYIAVEAFVEMSARLVGRIQALESILAVLLAERPDLEALVPRVDSLLLNDEASRIAENDTPEATMQTHEWARQSVEATLAAARISRRLNE